MGEKIIITKKAAEKIQEMAKDEKKQGQGLKLFVFPGGCSGLQYGMDFEKKAAKEDTVIEQHGVKLFVEKDTMDFVKGTKIDFIETEQGSGFKIDNPNVNNGCSSCAGCH